MGEADPEWPRSRRTVMVKPVERSGATLLPKNIFELHVVRGEIPRRNRLLLLISVNFYLRYASAKVGQKGDPFSNVAAVAPKPVKSDDTGRKW